MQRILLTDSDTERAQSVREALIESGFDVVTATTAAEARELFEFVRPEVVIADEELEDGCGAELCVALKGSPLGENCAFLLAATDVHEGVDACLARPIQVEDVVSWFELRVPEDEPFEEDVDDGVEAPEESSAESTAEVPIEVTSEVTSEVAVGVGVAADVATTASAANTVRATVAGDGGDKRDGSGNAGDTGEDISHHLDSLFSGHSEPLTNPAETGPVKLSPPVQVEATDIDLPARVDTSPVTPPAAPVVDDVRPDAATVALPAIPVQSTVPKAAPVADLPSRDVAVRPPPPAPTASAREGLPKWIPAVAVVGLLLAIGGWFAFRGRDEPSTVFVAEPPVGAAADPVAELPTEAPVSDSGPVEEAVSVAAAPVVVEAPAAVEAPVVEESPVAAEPVSAEPVAVAEPVAPTKPAPPKPLFAMSPAVADAPDAPPAAGFVGPVLLTRAAPVFDKAALEAAGGSLVLSVMVEGDGSVSRVIVDRAIGDWAIEDAAVDAVLHWRYRAAYQDGAAVAAWTTARFDF